MTRIEITINQQQLDRLVAKLGKIGSEKVLEKPLEAAGTYIKTRLDKGPAKSKGAFSRLATPAQKRAFWAQVRKGLARVNSNGYVRTGQTVRAWTVEVKGNTATVGNNAPGAPYVYGDPADRPLSQQPFHAESGWPRVDKVADKEAGKAARVFALALEKEIDAL